MMSSLLVCVARFATAAEIDSYAQTQAVFERFGVPPEPDSQPSIDPLQYLGTHSNLRTRLPFLDISGGSEWSRFASINGDELSSFQDRDSRTLLDFHTQLSSQALQAGTSEWKRTLLRILKTAPPERPLQGLRIAIDPGHMGSDIWDTRTGKYVEASIGGKTRRLSEGLLTLQTALLAEEELLRLGATVLLTRKTLAPVTPTPYESFDLSHWAREELRARSLEDWFIQLLPQGPPAFDSAPEIRSLFSETARGRYFIVREDLEARAIKIQEFRPDLTLIVHFDASTGKLGPRNLHSQAFVAGAFSASEFASRRFRREFTHHLLDPEGWDASVALSQSILEQFKTRLGRKLQTTGNSQTTRLVAPGVFSRNLALTRKLTGHAVTYLECLHYDDPTEFSALLAEDFELSIEGTNYPYSKKLAAVASAIVAGVRQFALSLKSNESSWP